jgi:hypothetical protein
MNIRARLVPALLGVVLPLGLVASAGAQSPPPPCDGCFTTPLAASGNGSCVVNMCYTYDPVAQRVTVNSVQLVLGADCSGLGVPLGSSGITPALMGAVQKEAIRIAIQNCVGCTTTSARIFSSVSPQCVKQTKTQTWIACTPDLCHVSYEVTCNPSDPYSWTWGTKWSDTPCSPLCFTGCQPACP